MKPLERQDWLYQRITEEPGRVVDILNRDFVDDYVEATGAREGVQMYGANKCPQLSRDLLEMKRAGLLKRHRTGVQGMAGMGFPTWVWSYRIP